MAVNYTDTIQLGRKAQIFVKEETTPGTIAYPTATDFIVPSGVAEFTQVPSYTDSTEIRDSRSLKDRFQDQNPAGSWSVPMYCRPSGTLGSVPDGAVLLKAAFGKETISGGVSVIYAPVNTDHITMTIAFGFQDMVFAILGATANEFKANLTNKGAVGFNFSGGFMTMLWAGKDELAAVPSGSDVQVDDARKFRPNMKVKFYDVSATTWDDNTGTGYTITAVNEGTDTLTTSPAPPGTLAIDDIVQGFLPSSPTEVGDPIAAKTGTVEFDAAVTKLLSMDVTLTNSFSYLEDEISTQDYPTAFVAERRSIAAATQIYLRTEDLPYFRKGQQQTQVSMVMKAGDTAGSKIELKLGQAVGNVPAVSGDTQKQLAIDFTGLATATLEDEVELKFV